METISNAVDKLSNSLRIFAEEQFRFNKLVTIDKEEAVNNNNQAFEAILESFHTVYDITKDKNILDYFKYADTTLLILLRNAIHHRNHLLFESWNSSFYLKFNHEKLCGVQFLLATYKNCNEDSFQVKHYYKIYDIYERLNHPQLKKFAEKHRKLFEKELSFSKITKYAKKEKYPDNQIYINIMPILISAMSRIFIALKENKIDVKGYDSKVYIQHFTSEKIVCLDMPIYDTYKICE